MTLAISKAVENGARAVICASTGNTSASAAAYGARAGLAVYVLIPAGKIAMGKLSQAMMHQATVIQVDGNFDQALSIVKTLSAAHHIELVNSLNPFRIEGQKTAAMEVRSIGRCPGGPCPSGWKCRQYHCLLERLQGISCSQSEPEAPADDRISGSQGRAHRARSGR